MNKNQNIFLNSQNNKILFFMFTLNILIFLYSDHKTMFILLCKIKNKTNFAFEFRVRSLNRFRPKWQLTMN